MMLSTVVHWLDLPLESQLLLPHPLLWARQNACKTEGEISLGIFRWYQLDFGFTSLRTYRATM